MYMNPLLEITFKRGLWKGVYKMKKLYKKIAAMLAVSVFIGGVVSLPDRIPSMRQILIKRKLSEK